MTHFALCSSFLFQVLAIAMITNTRISIVTIMRFESKGINAKED
jgi:hypothetical protein